MGQRRRGQEMRLKFDTITCGGCKGRRLLARTCTDCGERPKAQEIQYDLQRRERMVAEFRTARKVPDHTIKPVLSSLTGDLDELMGQVLGALSSTSRSGRTSEPLVDAFGEMDQFVASWANLLPRPHRNRGKVIGLSLSELAEGLELFLDALCAPDVQEAKGLERQGNKKIEQAGVTLDGIAELDVAEAAFTSGSLLGDMNRIGREARNSVGWKTSIAELDAALSADSGWDATTPGMGLQSRTILVLAQNLFDLQAFTKVVQVADDLTTRCSHDLAASSEWMRAHARAAAYLASGAMSVHHTLSSRGSSDLEAAQSMVTAVATWRDGVLRHSLATMLASSIAEYDRLVSKSGGHAVQRAASAYPGLLLDENLTPSLRNAGGHAGLDLTRAGVRIGDDEFSFDDFFDRVLAYLETTLATFVGVTLAMTRLGADLTCDAYLAPRDRDAAVALFLGVLNLTCDSVEVDGEALRLQVGGAEPDWMVLSAALSAMFPASVERAEILLSTDLGKRAFTTSLERIRQFADGIAELPTERAAIHLSAVVSASRLDGASPWPEESWERAVQAVIHRNEGTDLRTWVKNVRELRDFGREADQHAVVVSCETALAELRRPR